MPPNQEPRSVLFVCDDLWGEHYSAKCTLQHTGGCLKGDVPPSEARKFYIFETGIVQFGEYFWVQI